MLNKHLLQTTISLLAYIFIVVTYARVWSWYTCRSGRSTQWLPVLDNVISIRRPLTTCKLMDCSDWCTSSAAAKVLLCQCSWQYVSHHGSMSAPARVTSDRWRIKDFVERARQSTVHESRHSHVSRMYGQPLPSVSRLFIQDFHRPTLGNYFTSITSCMDRSCHNVSLI